MNVVYAHGGGETFHHMNGMMWGGHWLWGILFWAVVVSLGVVLAKVVMSIVNKER